MSLLQIFFRRILEYDGVDVEADPLQHPDLAVMSQRELADLPLMPANLGRHLPSHMTSPDGCRRHDRPLCL
jgi:hypothetical protein